MDRADKLRSNWTKASLQDAISEYEKAATLWTSANDFSNASQAILKSGDVYFLLSNYLDALKRYQTAEALAQKSGDWLAQANALSRMGRLQSFIGNNELAQQQLTKALDLFKQHNNDTSDNDYGEALSNLAEVSYAKGDFVKAREQFTSALNHCHNNPKGEAKVHLFYGYLIGSLGDPEKAVVEISRALELYREADDRIGEGVATSTLGLARSLKRDVNGATELHTQALNIFRTVGDRNNEAVALTALGQAYEGINDYPLAINQYEQALKLYEEIGAVDSLSITTFKLGRVHDLSGHPDQALAFYERSLQLSRTAGKKRTEANLLNEIARFYASHGRRELALQQSQKIQKFYEAIGDVQGQATALNSYGEFLVQLGQNEKALEAWNQALPLSEKSGDKGILISTLYNLSRANLAVGAPDVALSVIRRSLEIIEDLRANVATPDFRVSYLSGVKKHYDLCIKILMQLDQLHPGQGFAAEALLVSEKGRARLLLDLISESRAHQASELTLERERELRGLFRVQAQYRMDLVSSNKNSAEIAEIDNQLAQFRAEYQEIQAQLRQKDPHPDSLEQLLNLQQIQSELRNDDTMLLEYALGEERSYLWVVISNSIRAYELPARKTIEDAARELYTVMTARQGSDGSAGSDGQTDSNYQANVLAADNAYLEKATNLSQMLLGPLSPLSQQLGTKRLLVVTEGALQHIPLEALPVPISQTAGPTGNKSRTLLVETNEVVALPSMSTLIAIRKARNRSSSSSKLVAVIADPVFSSSDDRVQGNAGSSGVALASDQKLTPQTNQTRNGAFVRLTHASEEADAISAVAPWRSTLVAKGFDANREMAMSSDVGQYQIVHFATHGFLDDQHPELSGIVLTSVDRKGKSTNGLMPLQDIYSMDLSAELTVLSACQTALGKDIKGEGLIGLTHSFMSAGSNTVVASLWKVDDRATAVLMADFYESMLQQGMSPSTALRSAKLKLMQEKRWSAPYYWAGFVLQGEYTNRIAVVRYPWRRTGLVILSFLILGAVVLLFLKQRNLPPFTVLSI